MCDMIEIYKNKFSDLKHWENNVISMTRLKWITALPTCFMKTPVSENKYFKGTV